MLGLILVLLVVRLGAHVVRFGNESLQMDFAAFYTAGEAASRGLSPYVNHVDADPPLWDGVDVYRHSRFLYPPPVARMFQSLTLFSYAAAKWLWMVKALVALALALWVAQLAVDMRKGAWRRLIVATVAVGSFPLLALLERGQVDTVTLLLLVVTIATQGDERRSPWGGLSLALAVWIKPHCVFLLPFLLLRRRWRCLTGFGVGAAALLLAAVVFDGPGAISGYVGDELPRISRYGEGGSRSMLAPPVAVNALAGGLEPGQTIKDGRVWAQQALEFRLNAGIVRTSLGRSVWKGFDGIGLPIAPAQVSLVFLALGFFVIAGWQRWCGPPRGKSAELAYWMAVLVVILLAAPVSWAMGVVWMLPIVVLVVGRRDARQLLRSVPLMLCAAAVVFAALPDAATDLLLAPFGTQVAGLRYVLAELLALAGLLALWRAEPDR
ncbi:MAG: DUF2029 domain-containing protein [bacterium]|nr:DUF2029 domain-containing protein [bacterium]